MERKRIIVITPQENKYIQKAMNCSNVSVYEAVSFRKDNDLHKRIRKFAIERGNPIMVLALESDTIFITNRKDADKGMCRYMVQTFENGATLEGNMATGRMVVRDKHGVVKGIWESPRLSEIAAIQEMAKSF